MLCLSSKRMNRTQPLSVLVSIVFVSLCQRGLRQNNEPNLTILKRRRYITLYLERIAQEDRNLLLRKNLIFPYLLLNVNCRFEFARAVYFSESSVRNSVFKTVSITVSYSPLTWSTTKSSCKGLYKCASVWSYFIIHNLSIDL